MYLFHFIFKILLTFLNYRWYNPEFDSQKSENGVDKPKLGLF